MTEVETDLAALPTVSVIIAAYTSKRWNDTTAAVRSVALQSIPAAETILVIDNNPELLAKARAELTDVTVIPNAGAQGASYARNTGVAASHGEVVAFLDDDAVASPKWLESLLRHFINPEVVGTGGRLDPIWATAAPRWFPPEFNWAVGASYRGMPDHAVPVRNVWSGNMVIRRKIFDAIGGFREGFGKVGSQSSPEDTDLCLRASAAHPGGTWIFDPDGLCGHRVPAERERFSFFIRRCYNEGLGKAALSTLTDAPEATVTEREYTKRVLPRGMYLGLREARDGDLSGVYRSLSIAAGLMCAAGGFATGRAGSMVKTARSRDKELVP
jgi:glucosyl-dolichyl phosphate glucuronosyltransferase